MQNDRNHHLGEGMLWFSTRHTRWEQQAASKMLEQNAIWVHKGIAARISTTCSVRTGTNSFAVDETDEKFTQPYFTSSIGDSSALSEFTLSALLVMSLMVYCR